MQIPPIYSAIKVNGKKLYEYARKGQEVEIKPRQIEIYKISLIEINQIANTIEFEVSCSKGTYIRSLCEDIAKELNTVGYMKELRRVQVGEFLIKDSITVEDLQKNEDNKDFILSHFIDLQKYFAKFRIIELSQEEARKFLNGVKLSSNKENGIYRVQSENKLIGTGILENNKLKRDIIILT